MPEGLEVITALARLDGSVGWTSMVGCAGSLFATLARRETYDRIYQNGPDVAVCGSSQPAGMAEPTANGFRVTGRWPFASGCKHADWMGAVCKITKDGKPVTDAHGKPMIRGFMMPASDWEIEDTWYAAGLKGTGSHHIALRDARVRVNFFDLENGAACVPGPLYQAFRHLRRCSTARSRWAWPWALSMNWSHSPIPEGSSCTRPRRCGIRDVPVRAWPDFRRRQGGAGLSQSASRGSLGSRIGRNAERRRSPHRRNASRGLDRNDLRWRGGCVLCAWWKQRALRDFTAATALARPSRRGAARYRTAKAVCRRGQAGLASFG